MGIPAISPGAVAGMLNWLVGAALPAPGELSRGVAVINRMQVLIQVKIFLNIFESMS